jgi:GMP synthase PP-ATPase subunit
MERKAEILLQINQIAAPFGLTAEYLEGIQTVGVQGDDRSYTPTVVLIGPHPGDEELAALSNMITNDTLVNRVTFELAAAGKPSPFAYRSTKPPLTIEWD